MENRIWNALWSGTSAGLIVYSVVNDSASAYSWVILVGVMLWSGALAIWPDWIKNTPDDHYPWVVALMAAWATMFITWTLLLPTISIFIKVAAMTILAAFTAYTVVKTFKEHRDSRNSV